MIRTFIASPYAGHIERNVTYARKCVRHSLDRGEAPMASHLLYTQEGVLDDSVQHERLRGVQAGYEWLATSDVVAFYIDYGWSKGMLDELRIARISKRRIEIRSLYRPAISITPKRVSEILNRGPLGPQETNDD